MANGNDSAIVENGGELNTDDYSDIKLINKIEYDSLEDTEKPLWVRYYKLWLQWDVLGHLMLH